MVLKCHKCRRRSSDCARGSCKRFDIRVGEEVVRVLRHSFKIKKLYNIQTQLFQYLGDDGVALHDGNESEKEHLTTHRKGSAISGCFGPSTLKCTLRSSDVFVYVPTGYGKTLAYTLPVVKYLSDEFNRNRPHTHSGVRAIIVVPTHELASQVFNTFKPFTKAVPFSVAQLTGGLSLMEQQKLVKGEIQPKQYFHANISPCSARESGASWKCECRAETCVCEKACACACTSCHCDKTYSPPDVLIAVASRLGDIEIDGSLLRFMILDEADRLVAQSYASWLDALDRICSLQETIRQGADLGLPRPQINLPTNIADLCSSSFPLELNDAESVQLSRKRQVFENFKMARLLDKPRFQKLIFTATPITSFENFAALKPRTPIILSGSVRNKKEGTTRVESEFGNDESLLRVCKHQSEENLEVALEQVVGKLSDGGWLERVLVFSNVGGLRVREVCEWFTGRGIKAGVLSGSETRGTRSKTLRKFRHGDLTVMLATDLASRGLNVEGITAIIHLEVPSSYQAYVHRIGRGCRDKKTKCVTVTIVKNYREEKQFTKIVREANKLTSTHHKVHTIYDIAPTR